MNLYEDNTCAFIVKVWVERSDEQADQSFWRGYITHVFSGNRQYFEEMSMIAKFITPYLAEMGVINEQVDHTQASSQDADKSIE